jgi:hypothetical protein
VVLEIPLGLYQVGPVFLPSCHIPPLLFTTTTTYL